MDIVFLIGRILFGGYFLMMGFNHFMKSPTMTQYAMSKGVLSPKASVFITGLLLTLGGLGMLLGVYTDIAGILLIIFLLLAAFKMHNFWTMEDPEKKMEEMRYFMVNLALVGAVLMTYMISSWPLSL